MRLIRPAVNRGERLVAVAMSVAMLAVGAVAIVLMALLADRPDGVAVLGVAAALGIGVGLAWLIRAVSSRGRPPGDDLARLLAPGP